LAGVNFFCCAGVSVPVVLLMADIATTVGSHIVISSELRLLFDVEVSCVSEAELFTGCVVQGNSDMKLKSSSLNTPYPELVVLELRE